MQNSGLYTQMGIDLARQGRKREALPYLRYAVTIEHPNADVWLWLAHVSPDRDEYRHCVQQALTLEPNHPTALRMKQDLDYQALGISPALGATQVVHTMDDSHKRLKRLRRRIMLINAILAALACAVLARLAESRLDDIKAYLPLPEQAKTIQFAVGEEDIRFRVDVPESWFLADVGSATWQEKRDELQAEFPSVDGRTNSWRSFESDLSEIEPDPITGAIRRSVAVIETDFNRVEESEDAVPRLALVAIRQEDNSCAAFREMAAELTTETEQFIGSEVRERAPDNCVLVIQMQDISPAEVRLRVFQIYLPLDADRLAEWNLILPETIYQDHYQTASETVIDTLEVVQ
jgi:hypothetical protein